MAEREDFNTGLSEQEITQAFDRALHDYTDEEIDAKIQGDISAADAVQNTVIAQLLDGEPKNQARFNSLSTLSYNGVTITPNEEDGTITVSGSASGSGSYPIQYNIATRKIPSGTWVLSGCPSGGDGSTYKMTLSNTSQGVVYDIGDGVEFVSNPSQWSVLRIQIWNNFSAQTPIVFKPMICLKNSYDVSSKFVKNTLNNSELKTEIDNVASDLSDKEAADDALHTKQNTELVALVDGGGKNRITVNSGTTGSNNGYLVNNLPLVLPAGNYHVSMVRETEGQLTFVIKDANSAELARWSRASGITTVSEDITLESESATISIYVGNNVTVNNVMVCSKTDWDISNAFVPYRPSYQELYDMVLALQNGNRSLSAPLQQNDENERGNSEENPGDRGSLDDDAENHENEEGE